MTDARIQRVELTSLPSNLLTLDEVAERVPLTKERIKELTDTGYMPCWFIDETVVLYKQADVKKYIAENLVTLQEGTPYPEVLPVMAETAEAADIPPALQTLTGMLKKVKDHAPGVYFLILRGEVVYVGQSVNVPARVGAHRNDRGKEFDTAVYIPLGESDLLRVEKALIKSLEPVFNKDNFKGCPLSEEDETALQDLAQYIKNYRERDAGRVAARAQRLVSLLGACLDHLETDEGKTELKLVEEPPDITA